MVQTCLLYLIAWNLLIVCLQCHLYFFDDCHSIYILRAGLVESKVRILVGMLEKNQFVKRALRMDGSFESDDEEEEKEEDDSMMTGECWKRIRKKRRRTRKFSNVIYTMTFEEDTYGKQLFDLYNDVFICTMTFQFIRWRFYLYSDVSIHTYDSLKYNR